MWIWIGIGGAAAYTFARLRQKAWDFAGEPRAGQHAGQSVQYAVRERGLKHGVELAVGVPIAAGVEFRIAREGLFSGLLRRAGIGREVSTGLADFDRSYEIQSEDARLGRWLRDSPSARQAIAYLFGRRVRRLVAHRGWLWTEFVAERSGPQATRAATAMAATLVKLVAAQPPARPGREVDGVSLWSRAWLPMLWTYGWTSAALLGIAGHAVGQADYPATVNALSWGKQVAACALMLSPLTIWLAARWLRDSIMARIVLGEFILVGTLGFMVGTGVLAVHGNSGLASSPIETSEVSLIGHEVRPRRGGVDHFLVFAPFAPGENAPARIQVGADLHRHASRGGHKRFELRWRMGAFGQPVVVEAPTPVG